LYLINLYSIFVVLLYHLGHKPQEKGEKYL